MIAWTLRAQEKYQQAIDIQLGLEKEWDADGQPDPYVYEELEILYRAENNLERASYYAQKLAETKTGHGGLTTTFNFD